MEKFYVLSRNNLILQFSYDIILVKIQEVIMDAEIVVELLSRIKALEREVAELKRSLSEMKNFSNTSSDMPPSGVYGIQSKEFSIGRNTRDTTRYIFDGSVYSKKGLVYAVVKRYVDDHPDLLCADLKRTFDRSLQGSLGVVENIETAKCRGEAEYRVRFFTEKKQILHLQDGDMVVCTQWGIMNIPRFLAVAEQLGYQIKAIL